MPYRIRKILVKNGRDWVIQKKKEGSWKIVGRSKTKKDAEASIRARHMNEN